LPDSPAPSRSIFISFLAIILSRLSWLSISSLPRKSQDGGQRGEQGERTGFGLFVDGGGLDATHCKNSARREKKGGGRKTLTNPPPTAFPQSQSYDCTAGYPKSGNFSAVALVPLSKWFHYIFRRLQLRVNRSTISLSLTDAAIIL
jgi:hypothetical protein